MDFQSFVTGEAHSYNIGMLRLQEDLDDLQDVDRLYQELQAHTSAHDADDAYILYLAGSCQNRLYTSTLAYMCGQRGDAFSICRSAVEAAINAVLMHKGLLTKERFDEGGRAMLALYAQTRNPTNPKFVPELMPLHKHRDALSNWGPHAALSSFVFRVTEGPQAGETRYQLFEIAKDRGEFRYIFLSNLIHFTDALKAFAYIGLEQEKPWAPQFQRQVQALACRIAAKAGGIETPEVFGEILELPDN